MFHSKELEVLDLINAIQKAKKASNNKLSTNNQVLRWTL